MSSVSPRTVHSARGSQRQQHQSSSVAFSTTMGPPPSSAPSSARSGRSARWETVAQSVMLPPSLAHRTDREAHAQAEREMSMGTAADGERCLPLALPPVPPIGEPRMFSTSRSKNPRPAHQRVGDARTQRIEIDPGASSRVMGAIRDGVSSLCLSADTALSNFGDGENDSRHNAEASRRQNLLRTMETTMDHDGVSASMTLQHVLSSLLTASGTPIGADVALLLRGVTPLVPSQLAASRDSVDLTGGINGLPSPTAVEVADSTTRSYASGAGASFCDSTAAQPRDPGQVSGSRGNPVQLDAPDGASSAKALIGAKGLRSSQPLSIAKALDVGGVGGGHMHHPGDELQDISDAQMHVQTVLTLTKHAASSSQPQLQQQQSFGYPMDNDSTSASASSPLLAAPTGLSSQSLVMDAVRSASKQAVVHLHNAADAFRQQRLQIVELQEQIRKTNAVAVFSSARPTATVSDANPGAKRSFGCPSQTGADDYEFLLLVALDSAHLLDLELTAAQANALRSLFHRFVTTTVQRTNGCVVKEDPLHGHAYILSFPSVGEALSFERCVQCFSPYLPWKQFAASCGPLPSVAATGYASVLLQEHRADDCALLQLGGGGNGAVDALLPPPILDPMAALGVSPGQCSDEDKEDVDEGAAAAADALPVAGTAPASTTSSGGGSAKAGGAGASPSSLMSPRSGGMAQPKQRGVLPHDEVTALMQCIGQMEEVFRSSVTCEIHESVVALEAAATPMDRRSTTKQLKKQLSTVHAAPLRIQRSTSIDAAADDDGRRVDGGGGPPPAPADLVHAAALELLALCTDQLASTSPPTWAVRGPLVRCAMHYGCAAAEARRDRFAATNPMLDVLSTLGARCPGGVTAMSEAALRKCKRHLAIMNGGLVVVDNTLRAQQQGGADRDAHQQGMATRLCYELHQPTHYELQWPNLTTRYALLAAQATASRKSPSAGYDVWWWMRSVNRRNLSRCTAAAIVGMPWADMDCSTASTSTETRDSGGGASGVGSSPSRGKRSPSQQPRKTSIRGLTVTTTDDSGGESQQLGNSSRRSPSQSAATASGGSAKPSPLLGASPSGGTRRKSSSANRDLAAGVSAAEALSDRDTQTVERTSAPQLTRLVLEACQWMYAWIDGTLDEEALLQRLYDGCDTVGQRGTAPNWGELTEQAAAEVERFQSIRFGEDEVVARAAVALQFAGMRDVLREVSLYRRRKSNASPAAAAAAAAAATSNARKGAGGQQQRRPSYSTVWVETKEHVLSNPTAALMGGGGQRQSMSPFQGSSLATTPTTKTPPSPQPQRMGNGSGSAVPPPRTTTFAPHGDGGGAVTDDSALDATCAPPSAALQGAVGDDVAPEIAGSFRPGPF